MKFTGHERDLASPSGAGDDLDYMHARHESPVTGRFLSVDPVQDRKRSARQPQLWNRYSYVGNNPVRYTDPKGTCIEDLCIGEAVAAALAFAAETPAGQSVLEAGEAEVAGAAEGLEAEGQGFLSAAQRIAQNVKLGKIGERLAGIAEGVKKTAIDSITHTARQRIPDALDRIGKVLTEVKNVSGVLRNTNQLKDFLLWAQREGYRLVLWVKDPEKLSEELKALWDAGAIQVQKLPPPPSAK